MAGRGGIKGVLVDTGALVAMCDRADPWHGTVSSWLAAQGVLTAHPLDGSALARMAERFEKHRDQDPDWAHIALVVMGETLGLQRIATLDVADFSVDRLHGRKRFRLELLA